MLFPDRAQFGVDNLVLHGVARRYTVKDFPGPLSIKSVVKGAVTWTVDGRGLVVDTESFLVLNDGQKYSMDVDELRPIGTCCAFFSHGFVERVAQDATTPLQASLDAPARTSPPTALPLAPPSGSRRRDSSASSFAGGTLRPRVATEQLRRGFSGPLGKTRGAL
jgi:hypothetical protein